MHRNISKSIKPNPIIFSDISHSNSYYFPNASNNDILIYPETSDQAIHLGITSNASSAISINSNTMIINSTNLNINGATSLSNNLNVAGGSRSTILRAILL